MSILVYHIHMYIPYNKNLVYNSRNLRNNTTKQEKKLWYDYLSKFPIRFLRQKPIDNYIVDFYCPLKRLVIEIDGNQHFTEDGIQYDKIRTDVLEVHGITVIRITNWEIKTNFEGVCEYIEDIVQHIPDKKQMKNC